VWSTQKQWAAGPDGGRGTSGPYHEPLDGYPTLGESRTLATRGTSGSRIAKKVVLHEGHPPGATRTGPLQPGRTPPFRITVSPTCGFNVVSVAGNKGNGPGAAMHCWT